MSVFHESPPHIKSEYLIDVHSIKKEIPLVHNSFLLTADVKTEEVPCLSHGEEQNIEELNPLQATGTGKREPVEQFSEQNSQQNNGEHNSQQNNGEHNSQQNNGEHNSQQNNGEHNSQQNIGEQNSQQNIGEQNTWSNESNLIDSVPTSDANVHGLSCRSSSNEGCVETVNDQGNLVDNGLGESMDVNDTVVSQAIIKSKHRRPRKQVNTDSNNYMQKEKLARACKMKISENDYLKKKHGQDSSLNRPHCRPAEPSKFIESEREMEKHGLCTKTSVKLHDSSLGMRSTVRIKCDICHKIFQNLFYMTRHRKSHGMKAKYSCSVCKKKFKIKKAMVDHRKTHKKGYTKPSFPCTACSKSFRTQYILNSHAKSEHLGQKMSFLCSVCGKSFTAKHSLQEHSNTHTGDKPFVCTVCGDRFSYHASLRDHRQLHALNQDKTGKLFICEICSKGFRRKCALTMHSKVHTDVKEHVCCVCGQGFSQKHSLHRHERIHNGNRPFICKLCSCSFNDSSIIRRHMILFHKIHKDRKTWREDIVYKVNYSIDMNE